MKISNIQNQYSFNAKYNTADVIMLATKCPYKNRDTDKIIKSLTGIEIYSDEFKKSVTPEGGNDAFACFALEDICEQRVIEQVPRLQEARDEYTSIMMDIMDTKSRNNWIDKQVKKYGKTIDLQPFTVTMEELKAGYKRWVELVDYVTQKMWELDHKG